MPRSAVQNLLLGKERHAMAGLVIRLMESIRRDYIPKDRRQLKRSG
jgi:hypothetical protein